MAAFPDVVADVFAVGHCLYGCSSCSHDEHRQPLYFTRSAPRPDNEDVRVYCVTDYQQVLQRSPAIHCRHDCCRVRYWPQSPLGFGACAWPFYHAHDEFSVLVAPSFGEFSTLCDDSIIDALINLKQAYSNFHFVVKLHPSLCDCSLRCYSLTCVSVCYLDTSHPLHGLNAKEQAGVDRLRANFDIVPADKTSILPFRKAASIVIAEADSSIPFEALYFSPKTILAFLSPRNDVYTPKDASYHDVIHVYKSASELSALFAQASMHHGSLDRDGIPFFTSKYGSVDGKEVERVAELRWSADLV